MKAADLRIAWRLLLREPGHSAVAVLGLAAAFAACFLLLGYVRHCLSYDGHVPDQDRVYAVKQRINVFPRPAWQRNAYLPLRRAAMDSGVVETSTIAYGIGLPLRAASRLHQVSLQAVDQAFGPMFAVRAIAGDLDAALAQPDGLALTQSAARQMFGAQPALGQQVEAGGQALQVRAIVADPPAATMQPYAALVGITSNAWSPADRQDIDTTNFQRGGIYLKLKPGADAVALARQLQEYVEQSPNHRQLRNSALGQSLQGRNITDVALVPLRGLYFDAGLAQGPDGDRHGRRGAVLALGVVTALILVLAASNYVNLATIRTVRRQREIAMRKLLGTGPARLASQLVAESVLVAVLAALCGMLLAWMLLPAFGALVSRPLEAIANGGNAALALLLALATGVCAGAYPAWIAVGVRPAAALAGRGDVEGAAGLWLRRVLTVLQFAVAMGLSGTAIAMAWQAHYAGTAWRGFDPAGLYTLDMPAASNTPQGAGFMEALRNLPDIQGVAGVSEAVGRDGQRIIGTVRGRDGRDVRLELKMVRPEFFQLHGIRPLHGRLFDPARDRVDAASGTGASGGSVLNPAAALALGFATPAAAVGGEYIGVAPDIRFASLRQPAQPMIYMLGSTNVLTIRSTGGIGGSAALQERIQPLWDRYFPDLTLDVRPVASWFGAAYEEDVRMARMLGAAGVIATALAASGIYVLSAYGVQRRRREIVLRKLHGAGPAAITRLVGREFAVLLGAGAILGLPPAAVAIQRHLSGFAEHAPIGIWPLAGALALAVLMALAATARHTVAALRLPAVAALRG